MRGIILAGGTGSRLSPITLASSKQLLPVYDKPMIYYPLSTLMLAGIRDVLIITTPRDADTFVGLLGDGSRFGINLRFAVQPKPEGVAQAFVLAADYLGHEAAALALGDNIFYGAGLGTRLREYADIDGAVIFGYHVADPSAYGVIELGPDGRPVSLQEKPLQPRSTLAVPGLYFYDNSVLDRATELRPSARGELEITDLNRSYLRDGKLRVEVLPRGTTWLDVSTVDSLNDASNFVRTIQNRQHTKIAAPEEVAWRMGWLSDQELLERAERFSSSGYGEYLIGLVGTGPPKDAQLPEDA